MSTIPDSFLPIVESHFFLKEKSTVNQFTSHSPLSATFKFCLGIYILKLPSLPFSLWLCPGLRVSLVCLTQNNYTFRQARCISVFGRTRSCWNIIALSRGQFSRCSVSWSCAVKSFPNWWNKSNFRICSSLLWSSTNVSQLPFMAPLCPPCYISPANVFLNLCLLGAFFLLYGCCLLIASASLATLACIL